MKFDDMLIEVNLTLSGSIRFRVPPVAPRS